ncbi:ABSCISIC ACID-INSENSITIVE 5-like protein 6 isoform X1 [Salvia splendens]|uniref:ABSCISIC ACID-INSENSITIVE 5-like protein 6 isoform X1 n=1 Tax=Salvia splendens TaxID=180675 RepID=UPI001C26CD3C|nr:ABSCISIC ACID-INSENSITIVE 5-like protein 6 isoform X1 [Salvia splendens]XP_041992962.1 ABSCISIC ACID-INSENSITIVE 5-like protein 6 isoform X1 [Salvia splendens]XP_041992963.1 ABSCISIC ACID-INSENSITIVE 5-like protein 6 isoform X1 [Salvia splendens]XP_041992964.1 ABSCISIC ACID-INSENSITIVE 5-like protein 6 isoform X1 [Salvia splendens]XP_041992965.1 ABSCISIC ACID-INSENSITIVE 5-like protein 6 isoform X1 [Salvia splendens]
MGIQTMNSHVSSGGQQSHVQHHPLQRCNSWLGLTLDEVERHLLGNLAKPLGSMNLDELLKKVWTTDTSHSSGMESIETSPAVSLQRQASWSLARAFTGKTVNEVWRDIQRGYKMSNVDGFGIQERTPTLGEMTLEDFLVKAGMYVSNASTVSIEPMMSLDSALKSHKFSSQMRSLSPSPSIDDLSDTPLPGRKRMSGDLEKTVERRLRRKIKNRESAARSRARKQAYHNQLVTKVSRLEEENSKLKKEKEFEQITTCEPCTLRFQLRRTSSF